jgi:hypothetical protein
MLGRKRGRKQEHRKPVRRLMLKGSCVRDLNVRPRQISKMNKIMQKNRSLAAALLGVMVASQALAATIRYQSGGDYFDTVAVTGHGWQAGGTGPGGVPGTADTARFNWASNTVSLAGAAPGITAFQMGVDESGGLVVNSGGLLAATGNSTVGNNAGNGGANLTTGFLTINPGGTVNNGGTLQLGAGASSLLGNLKGIITIDGGSLTLSNHLWVGAKTNTAGTITITNGGVLNMLGVGGNGMLGLGTINASTASGGQGFVNVQDGGLLQLFNISGSAQKSIWPGSRLDISGSGVVTIPGNFTNVMSGYTNAARITAYGGLGTVGIDYNNTNVGKTTLFAIAPAVPPPTDVAWNPAANPSGTGKWNEPANWTGGAAPADVTKANFNVVGAIPCTVTNAALADYVVMGENGPGGTLIITNGGSLTCGAASPSTIGLNSNALMVVENGGSAGFGNQLWIGADPGSDGTLIMNGGTVSVAGMFGLGNWAGGKGTAHIMAGTLNLSHWNDGNAIQGESVLDVSGTGIVVIGGNHQASVNNFVSVGQITNQAAPGTVVVDYNNINVGKTTIYPSGVYVPPAQVTWNPALNFPDIDGLWNNPTNWTGGVGPTNATIVFWNVTDAIPCLVTNAAFAKVVRMGTAGPGGTLIITNGGSLACASADDWSAIGYNNAALMVIENGASASFGNHLWIGFTGAGDGTLIINGGTVSVAQMFGLGWSGGKGTALIHGGTLNLSQWSAGSPGSIAGASVLDLAGTGKVVITGNYFNSVSNYVSVGKITADGGTNVFYSYDSAANKTTISAVALPPPQQKITAVLVSGSNVTITYQTTHQHTYYIECTASLSPVSWVPVAGSTNAATGDPVTFTFPMSGGQMFYRTVSLP